MVPWVTPWECFRLSSESASNFDMAWAVVKVITHPWPIVAAPVAAGEMALQIRPLGAITSILFSIPWFQGMPDPSRGATPPKMAPTRQPSVQLI